MFRQHVLRDAMLMNDECFYEMKIYGKDHSNFCTIAVYDRIKFENPICSPHKPTNSLYSFVILHQSTSVSLFTIYYTYTTTFPT
jgi:hypothetical protein